MTFEHIIYIPGMLLVGVTLGYILGARAVREGLQALDDPQLACLMFRSQEMSRYVEDGVIDFGICGHDWVIENDSDVHEVCELRYSRATSNPAPQQPRATATHAAGPMCLDATTVVLRPVMRNSH